MYPHAQNGTSAGGLKERGGDSNIDHMIVQEDWNCKHHIGAFEAG